MIEYRSTEADGSPVRLGRDGETAVIHLSGELDISVADELKAGIQPLLQSPPERAIVDVEEVTFMDSSALAVLIMVMNAVPSVVLRKPAPIVARLIELSGLGGLLPTE